MKETTSSSQTSFITGLDLAESFFQEAVEPILKGLFSHLRYSAALIGSGSEVLGFDTDMSADHHWGPRVMLFVGEDDLPKYRADIVKVLSEKLPRKFRGYPTSFTPPELNEKGIQLLDTSNAGPINHRVEISSMHDFFLSYLGFDINEQITPADWLTFPEQKLRSITTGRVFKDDIGLEDVRKRFDFYPHDLWLYLLASRWQRIEQEEHLMGRAGLVGDEIGSAIIGSRLVRDLMYLCFHMEKSYAPYPKWFGTGFRQLIAAKTLEPLLIGILKASNWEERQKFLSRAYEYVATLHNQLAITEPMPTKVVSFFDRPFLVISMGAFSKAISARITDPAVKKLLDKPFIGNIDQLSDNTDILHNASWRHAIRNFFTTR